jgi:hypothetical protein
LEKMISLELKTIMEEFKNKKEAIAKIVQLKVKPNQSKSDKLLIQKLQQKLDELQD